MIRHDVNDLQLCYTKNASNVVDTRNIIRSDCVYNLFSKYFFYRELENFFRDFFDFSTFFVRELEVLDVFGC